MLICHLALFSLQSPLSLDVAERPHLGHGRRAGGRRARPGQARPAGPRGQGLHPGRGGQVQGARAREVRRGGLAVLRQRPPVGRRRHRPQGHAEGARSRAERVDERQVARGAQLWRFQDVKTGEGAG